MKNIKFNRRKLLQGSGGIALASPFLSSITAKPAHAMGTGLDYIVMIDIGYGSYDSVFFPQPGAIAPNHVDKMQNVKIWNTKDVIQTSKMFAGTAIETVADQVSIYQGLDRLGFRSHQASECLTGSSQTEDGWFSQSIDQIIAKDIYASEPYLRSLHLGGLGGANDISFYLDKSGIRRPSVSHQSGANAIAYMFSSIGATEAQTQAIRNGNLSLVGAVKEDYRRLLNNSRLGRSDVLRLQKHMDILAELEQKIREKNIPVCSPEGLEFQAHRLSGNVDHLHDYLQTAHRVLSCGLTKVITISIRGGLHDFSHGNAGPDSNPSQIASHLERRQPLFEEIGRFLHAMASDKDPDGKSLLDRGMVMVSSDMGSCYNHGNKSFPALVAGGGRRVNTGKFIDYRSPVLDQYRERHLGYHGQPYCRLLKSTMMAMGLGPGNWEMNPAQQNYVPGFGEFKKLMDSRVPYWMQFAQNYDPQMGLPYFSA